MSTKNERICSCIYGMLGAGIFTLIYHSGPAVAQTIMGFMVVQPTTPGLTQTGHANISGTMRAGQFVGGGSGLTSLNASQLTGTIPSAALSGTYSNPVALTNAGNSFTGNGGGLTNLQSAALTGVISPGLLPFSFARLDAANVFGPFNNTFQGRVGVGQPPLPSAQLAVTGGIDVFGPNALIAASPTGASVQLANAAEALRATRGGELVVLADGAGALRAFDGGTGHEGGLGAPSGGAWGYAANNNHGVLGTTTEGAFAQWGLAGPNARVGTALAALVADNPGNSNATLAASGYGLRAQSAAGAQVTLAGPAAAVEATGVGGPGVLGQSTTGDHGVVGFADPGDGGPLFAGLYARGAGVAAPGVPRGAALRIDSGAVLSGGPPNLRFTGSVMIPPPWAPIYSCMAGLPTHAHPIGYYHDEVISCDLVMAGGPGMGSVIQATVESVVPPMGNVSYSVQIHSKVAGAFTARVTRMGDPGACAPPTDPLIVHYTVINLAP